MNVLVCLETRVMAGVAWLDENGPAEWWDRVDLFTLNIDSPFDCVLGQVFAADADTVGYSTGYIYAVRTFPEMLDAGPRFGFIGLSHIADEELTKVWLRVIHARREEVNA